MQANNAGNAGAADGDDEVRAWNWVSGLGGNGCGSKVDDVGPTPPHPVRALTAPLSRRACRHLTDYPLNQIMYIYTHTHTQKQSWKKTLVKPKADNRVQTEVCEERAKCFGVLGMCVCVCIRLRFWSVLAGRPSPLTHPNPPLTDQPCLFVENNIK